MENKAKKDDYEILIKQQKKYMLYSQLFNRKYPNLAGYAKLVEKTPKIEILIQHFLDNEIQKYNFENLYLDPNIYENVQIRAI